MRKVEASDETRAMTQAAFTVKRGEKSFGPFSQTQLKQLATSGKLQPNDIVIDQSTQKSALVSRIKGLLPDQAKLPPRRRTEERILFWEPVDQGDSRLPIARPRALCITDRRMIFFSTGNDGKARSDAIASLLLGGLLLSAIVFFNKKRAARRRAQAARRGGLQALLDEFPHSIVEPKQVRRIALLGTRLSVTTLDDREETFVFDDLTSSRIENLKSCLLGFRAKASIFRDESTLIVRHSPVPKHAVLSFLLGVVPCFAPVSWAVTLVGLNAQMKMRQPVQVSVFLLIWPLVPWFVFFILQMSLS